MLPFLFEANCFIPADWLADPQKLFKDTRVGMGSVKFEMTWWSWTRRESKFIEYIDITL